MNKLLKELTTFAICISLLGLHANAQISSSGNYTLMQTAIANGGASGNGASLGGNYSVEGTTGQSAAGTNEQNLNYNFKPGFWSAQPLAPSAAAVIVGGRILTASGSGIRNVYVTLTGSNGESRTAISSSFGYFRLDDIPVGETYIISVSSKRFLFANPSQVISVSEEITEINFVAEP